MTNKCKKCKNICTQCYFYIEENEFNESRCKAYSKKVMNCVNGEINTVYAYCEDKNKTGCCTKFKMDEGKKVDRELIAALHNWRHHNYPNDFSNDANITKFIAKQLRIALEDGEDETNFFVEYDDDGDGEVYAKKECLLYGKDTERYKKWRKRFR